MFRKIKPKAGQESVWDYPRPPLLEATNKHIRIVFNQKVIAETNHALRMLETSHPPVYYLPLDCIVAEVLHRSDRQSFCEFKGMAGYYDLKVGEQVVKNAAWYYSSPSVRYLKLKNHVAFYPSMMDACYVNDEKVQAQEGDFYGGWITSDIVGPFKGGSGTWGW